MMVSRERYLAIKERIIRQEYGSGQVFTPDSFSSAFGIEEADAADILYRLASENFLSHTGRNEFTVNEIRVDEINETFEVRKALESLAAKLAILHMTDEHAEELTTLLDECQGITDEFTYAECDDAIHRKVRNIAGNRSLSEYLLGIEEKEHCWWFYLNKHNYIEDPVRLALNDHSLEYLIRSLINQDMINGPIAINEHLDYWYHVYNNSLPQEDNKREKGSR